MRDAIDPLVFHLRALVFRAPKGPRTPDVPVPAPLGLEPPPTLNDAENGYGRLTNALSEWPSEGRYPPDLAHWRRNVARERKAAERALSPLRPFLERLDGTFDGRPWQARMTEDGGFPELRAMRRLSQAWLLRAALDGRSEDRDRAVELARRLRGCQGPFLHFLVGLGIERQAEGGLPDLAREREEAVRWELARFVVPRAHRNGPWEPVSYEEPPAWADARRGIQWAVARHPLPYDPTATVETLVREWDLMASGTSAEIHQKALEEAAPWPAAMLPANDVGPAQASLIQLRRARTALASVPNPYGRLSVGRTLRSAANLARAVEAAER